MDNKIIQVALDGLENILRVGEADRGDPPRPGSFNKYAVFIEEANGLEKIHQCQQNANNEIYKKAYHIIDAYISLKSSLMGNSYYNDDEDEIIDPSLAPGQEAGQFAFGSNIEPSTQQNFNFADDVNME